MVYRFRRFSGLGSPIIDCLIGWLESPFTLSGIPRKTQVFYVEL